MAYRLLTDELIAEIDASPLEDQNDWIILGESEEFPGFWKATGLDQEFFYDFEDILGRYRLVSPARLDLFLEGAEERRYRVAFVEEPTRILTLFDELRKVPPVTLHSSLENTVNGLLPWQVIGFNKLIDSDLSAGIAVWDTGTGKTALEAAALRHYLDQGAIDLGLVVVKAHNKIDTQRKLLRLADVDSIVIDGYKAQKRFERYEEMEEGLARGPLVAITNYETFRNEPEVLEYMLEGRRVFFCWDEIPTKLSNRDTALYQSVKRCLYETFPSKPRTTWAKHLLLSATPIENDPDGLYSYVNLARPRTLGTVAAFQAEHVGYYIPVPGKKHAKRPGSWINLDKIEAKLEHMTHRVSKADPEVRAMFPEMFIEDMVIDWHPKDRAVYDRFTKACEAILEDEEDSGINTLSMIQVLQMLCDAPTMVLGSAENRVEFLRAVEEGIDTGGAHTGSEAALRLVEMVSLKDITNARHTKLATWRDIIEVKHPESKIVTHSTWASYIFPIWHQCLDEWGISYVTYTGTDKAKQTALDAFREDPSIRVFLSGDAGADSIDIPQADVGVSFNGAWKSTTMLQRRGRINRVDSGFGTNWYYNLMMADSVEDRKKQVRDLKQSYHDAIFEGRAVETALSARMDAGDLLYILRGEDA